jgi:hypothetical protein
VKSKTPTSPGIFMNNYTIVSIMCLMPSLLNSMNPNRLWEAAHSGKSYGEWVRGEQEKVVVANYLIANQQPQNTTTQPVIPAAVKPQKEQTDEK